MASKIFIWNGPPTAVEVTRPARKEGEKPEVIFEGTAVTGLPIGKPLPEDNEQVKGWIAFGLVTEAPDQKAATAAKQEPING